jgi:hypothetical protein
MATIIKGENATVRIRVYDKSSGAPYAFAGFAGATALFYSSTEGVPVSVTGTNPETNLLSFAMSTSQSELLQEGDSQAFEYRWEQSGNLYIERIENELNVLAQLF